MEARDIEQALTLDQAGRMLGITAKTVKRRIDKGLIPAHVDPHNGRLIVDKAAIEEVLSIKTPYVPPDKEGITDTSGNAVA